MSVLLPTALLLRIRTFFFLITELQVLIVAMRLNRLGSSSFISLLLMKLVENINACGSTADLFTQNVWGMGRRPPPTSRYIYKFRNFMSISDTQPKLRATARKAY